MIWLEKKYFLQEQWFLGREQRLQEQARSLGIDVKGGYSKSLDYLVIGGDVGAGNSKYDAAQIDNITIVVKPTI